MNITQKFDRGFAILSLHGNPLSEPDSISLKNIVVSILNSGIKKIILDLAQVKHINSNGIGALLHIRKKIENVNGEVKLAHVNDKIKDILKRTALEKYFRTYPTTEHALQN